MIALALLPSIEIEKVFEHIKKETQEKFGNFFNEYFDYFEKTWIKGFKPSCFSVYKKIDRTNNSIESYHKILNSMIKNSLNATSFMS